MGHFDDFVLKKQNGISSVRNSCAKVAGQQDKDKGKGACPT